MSSSSAILTDESWALITALAIITLTSALIFFNCAHKVSSDRATYNAELAIVLDLCKKLHTLTDEEVLKLTDRIEKLKTRTDGIYSGLAQAVVDPVLDSEVTRKVDMMVYHTVMGRLAVQAADSMLLRIDAVLTLLFTLLVNGYVERVLISQLPTADQGNAFVRAFVTVFVVGFLFDVFKIHVHGYLYMKLGAEGVYGPKD